MLFFPSLTSVHRQSQAPANKLRLPGFDKPRAVVLTSEPQAAPKPWIHDPSCRVCSANYCSIKAHYVVHGQVTFAGRALRNLSLLGSSPSCSKWPVAHWGCRILLVFCFCFPRLFSGFGIPSLVWFGRLCFKLRQVRPWRGNLLLTRIWSESTRVHNKSKDEVPNQEFTALLVVKLDFISCGGSRNNQSNGFDPTDSSLRCEYHSPLMASSFVILPLYYTTRSWLCYEYKVVMYRPSFIWSTRCPRKPNFNLQERNSSSTHIKMCSIIMQFYRASS